MERTWISRSRIAVLVVVAVAVAGCGASGGSYVHPNIDFSYMKRAAILPFQNQTTDFLAGERIQSIFLMELLQAGVLEIVDPRETLAALEASGLTAGTALTPEQSVELGKRLGVEALFFGVVEEYVPGRSDRSRGPEVTVVLGMTETQTGTLVWRCQEHATGGSIWKRLFGGTPDDVYTVSSAVVRNALRTLL